MLKMKSPKLHIINGAVVALYTMKEVESVSLSLDFYAGCWHEGADWGAHHLLEHVVFDGSEKFPTDEENEMFKEENGLRVGGSTGGDKVGYFLTAPKTKVVEGITLLFDQVFRPILREADIEREKTIIAQEYKDRWSSPNARFGRASSDNIFGKGHTYSRDGMGEIDYVKTVTRDDLLQIQKKFMTPANCRIVVVGNFDEEKVLKLIKTELESREAGKLMGLTISDFTPREPLIRHNEDVKKVSIYVEWFSKKYTIYSTLKERLTMSIARYLIGGSMHSILMKELRMKRGWVYDAGASVGFSPTYSYFSVDTSTEVAKFNDVMDLLHSLPVEYGQKGVEKKDYERAINYMKSSQLIAYDSPRAIGGSIASDLYRSVDNKVYLPDEIVEIIGSISQDEVLKMVNEYFSSKPVVSILASKEMELKI